MVLESRLQAPSGLGPAAPRYPPTRRRQLVVGATLRLVRGSRPKCAVTKLSRLSMNRLVAQAASLRYRRLPVGGVWNRLKLRTLRASSRLATSCVRHAERLLPFGSLSPRGTSGERVGERGKLIKSASSPRPSPPF